MHGQSDPSNVKERAVAINRLPKPSILRHPDGLRREGSTSASEDPAKWGRGALGTSPREASATHGDEAAKCTPETRNWFCQI